ncbi:MAG TPA: tetratricopeptide repeat protein [Flavobacterium sp.]|nr:tetratricopeptide repeat protein [Flavobacterium sp.]
MATYNKRGYKAPKPVEENEFEPDPLDSISEKDSTTAGVFNSLDEGASKTEEWVAKNQKGIFIFIGVIAIGALGYLGYNKFVAEPKQDDAANVMFQAQKHFQQAADSQDPKASDSLFALSLKVSEGQPGFVQIAEDYSGTDAANMANYYAGIAYLNIKKYKEAIDYLEKFSSKDMFLAPIAKGAIGDAYSQMNQPKEALEYYVKAAELNENEVTSPRFLLKAGQTALALKKKDDALKYFTEIKEKYENSLEAANIDAMIGLAQ